MKRSRRKKSYRFPREEFLVFAIKHSKLDRILSIDEFLQELLRFKNINRTLNSNECFDGAKIKALINNIVILGNIFPLDILNPMLFCEIREENWVKLKTILLWLQYIKDDKSLKLPTTPPVIIKLNSIRIDKQVLQVLNESISVNKYVKNS